MSQEEEVGAAVRQAFLNLAPDLGLAAELNRVLHGRWHCWFVSLGGRVEWMAAPVAGEVAYPVGTPALSAWEPIGLICQIANQDAGSAPLLCDILAALRDKPMAPGGGVTGSH